MRITATRSGERCVCAINTEVKAKCNYQDVCKWLIKATSTRRIETTRRVFVPKRFKVCTLCERRIHVMEVPGKLKIKKKKKKWKRIYRTDRSRSEINSPKTMSLRNEFPWKKENNGSFTASSVITSERRKIFTTRVQVQYLPYRRFRKISEWKTNRKNLSNESFPKRNKFF